MRKLQFVCSHTLGAYPFHGQAFLYNTTPYLSLKAEKFGQPIVFFALDNKVAVARICFFLIEQSDNSYQAVSLPESPFGSLEYGCVSSSELIAFMGYVMSSLQQRNVKKVVINDCIEAYRNTVPLPIREVFAITGFCEAESFPNHHIEIVSTPLEENIHLMEKRRLKKCHNKGFTFEQNEVSFLSDYYHFLQQCRSQKGQSLSLSYKEVEQQAYYLNNEFRLFSVFYRSERVAAALCIQVSANILYVFYPGYSQVYRGFSPTVMLIAGIYSYCQKYSIDLLDLGTSHQQSLMRFKSHMGGQASKKKSYQINY